MSGNDWKSAGTVTHQGIKYQTRGASTFAADGMSFNWQSEVSADGKTWQVFAKGKATKVTPAPADTASVEKELIKLEEDWARALVARDIQTLDRIEADDWIYTDPDGTASTKPQDMGDLKSGAYVATSYVGDDMKARVYGETAVVTGRTTETSTYKGTLAD